MVEAQILEKIWQLLAGLTIVVCVTCGVYLGMTLVDLAGRK